MPTRPTTPQSTTGTAAPTRGRSRATTATEAAGQDGKTVATTNAGGSWATSVASVNSLIDDLVRPTTEVARVIMAVADGDLSQKMALKIEGSPSRESSFASARR